MGLGSPLPVAAAAQTALGQSWPGGDPPIVAERVSPEMGRRSTSSVPRLLLSRDLASTGDRAHLQRERQA